MNQSAGFCEKEMITDMLTSQKQMTSLYNTSANESAAPQVRDEFLNILSEEHQMQAELFDEMNKRGWYQTAEAQQQKIQQAVQKYSSQG